MWKQFKWFFFSLSSVLLQMSYCFGIYGLLSTICIVFSMISTPCGQYAGSQARRTLHDRLLQSIVQKSIYFFQIAPFGRLMNRFSLDMAVIDKVKWYSFYYILISTESTTIKFRMCTYFIDGYSFFPFFCSLSFSFDEYIMYRKLLQQVNAFFNSYCYAFVRFYWIQSLHPGLLCWPFPFVALITLYKNSIAIHRGIWSKETLEFIWKNPDTKILNFKFFRLVVQMFERLHWCF